MRLHSQAFDVAIMLCVRALCPYPNSSRYCSDYIILRMVHRPGTRVEVIASAAHSLVVEPS